MLSTDPGDVPGSYLPGDIVPPQAMANGGTIIRPGAVAWGSARDAGGRPAGGRYSSCEAIERALTAVTADSARLPGLLAELAASRLWVPLPERGRPFTDGAAVRLPLVGYQGTGLVPCFTSVQRLTTWAEQGEAAPRRAGDTRAVPHVVLPAAGLADRLPDEVGLALNPGSTPGIPLYPECVPFLAALARPWLGRAAVPGGLVGYPPGRPATLLAAVRAALDPVPAARQARAAWLSVPAEGAGLVIAVTLAAPGDPRARDAAALAVGRAAAAVPLHVPFPLDVTFPGEPGGPDPVGDWITANVRPFHRRG